MVSVNLVKKTNPSPLAQRIKFKGFGVAQNALYQLPQATSQGFPHHLPFSKSTRKCTYLWAPGNANLCSCLPGNFLSLKHHCRVAQTSLWFYYEQSYSVTAEPLQAILHALFLILQITLIDFPLHFTDEDVKAQKMCHLPKVISYVSIRAGM